MAKRTILQVRRDLCLRIAEQIEARFKLHRRHEYDVDEAMELIDSLIPDTYDEEMLRAEEAEKELQELTPQPEGPSLGRQLREALGFHEGAPLKVVLEAAIKVARERRKENP